jgi:hypothetical protein
MVYKYPLPSGDYHFNLLQRVRYRIAPDILSGLSWSESEITLNFSRVLTVSEKAILDGIMEQSAFSPPADSVEVFSIVDLWENLNVFENAVGIPFELYYGKSCEGLTCKTDIIELHFLRQLTEAERSKVSAEYSKLIRKTK